MKKTAWITGASRGIGKSIAIKLAKEGYHLALCCKIDLDRLINVKKQCESFGVNCHAFTCDVSSLEQVELARDTIFHQFGEVNLLVNNAGISYIGLLSDMKDLDWNHVIETNLSSCFYTCKTLIPSMIQAKEGRIINISSIWGTVGASCEVAYSASKGGMNSFTKALAKELAPSGISVNALACGLIDTNMNHSLSEEELDTLQNEIPAGRMGKCEEVADMVYLLANAPIYCTGQIISFDGGWVS